MKRKRNKHSSYFGKMINPSRFHVSQIKFILILAPLLIIMLLPILFIISHAFMTLDELYAYPPKFFASRITLDNFTNLFELSTQTGVPLSRYLFNSILICIVVILATLFLSSLAAYAFTFLEFKGKKLLFSMNQVAIMFIPIAVAVPRYVVLYKLGITNTFLAHIIPLLAMPVGIFLLKQFMDQIPKELIDASKIDGANKFKIYWNVVLPLVKPSLATVAILAFQVAWNSTEASQLFISNETLKNLPYYFQTMSLGTSSIATQGIISAANLIIFLPNIIVFIILQNKVMNTMAHSGIK